MSPGTIVVAEDDPNIADLVALYLRQDGWQVHLCREGEEAIAATRARAARLVVLDIGLAGEIDGLEVCRRLRAETAVPVIMLTARDTELDRVLGLELGADDYLTKPFSPRELVARVKAVLRRTDGTARAARPAVYVLGTVEVDLGRREVRVSGEPVALATREFDLLAHLCENRGLALSRQQLLDGVWGEGWVGDERTVDVHVKQLRKKLGPDVSIATVWGVGYRLD